MRPASGDAEGLRGRSRRREFEDHAVNPRRQEPGPSLVARTRFADCAVKAASRAQARAERSGAERLESAIREQQNESATAHGYRDAHPKSHDAQPLPAWRERPQPWPRARSQIRSDLVETATGKGELVDAQRGWYITGVTFTIDLEREEDGRWIAEVPALPGVLCYGQDRDEAVAGVQALALRVIAERLENREAPAEFINVTFQAA